MSINTICQSLSGSQLKGAASGLSAQARLSGRQETLTGFIGSREFAQTSLDTTVHASLCG
jgi:hypothetical protein